MHFSVNIVRINGATHHFCSVICTDHSPRDRYVLDLWIWFWEKSCACSRESIMSSAAAGMANGGEDVLETPPASC